MKVRMEKETVMWKWRDKWVYSKGECMITSEILRQTRDGGIKYHISSVNALLLPCFFRDAMLKTKIIPRHPFGRDGDGD